MERGLFLPTSETSWERKLEDEGTSVTASIVEGRVSFSIYPSISMYAQHRDKRLAASVLFEVAARYAQHVNGEVVQRGLVGGCRPSGTATGDVVIARYPHVHLEHAAICTGFQAVLQGRSDELPLEDDDGWRKTIPV